MFLWSFWLLLAGIFHSPYMHISFASFDLVIAVIFLASGVLPLLYSVVYSPIVLAIMTLFMLSACFLFRLKNWARRLAVRLSMLIVACFIVHFLCMIFDRKTLLLVRHGIQGPAEVKIEEILFYLYLSSYALVPAIFFSIYFTRQGIRKVFNAATVFPAPDRSKRMP